MYSYSCERLCDHVVIIRRHPPGGKLGDTYDWCCTMVDGQIKGVVSMAGMKLSDLRAFRQFVFEQGFSDVTWERLEDQGRVRTVHLLPGHGETT